MSNVKKYVMYFVGVIVLGFVLGSSCAFGTYVTLTVLNDHVLTGKQ